MTLYETGTYPAGLAGGATLLTVKAASVDIDDPNPFRRRVQVPDGTGRALGTFTVIVRGQPSLSLGCRSGGSAELSLDSSFSSLPPFPLPVLLLLFFLFSHQVLAFEFPKHPTKLDAIQLLDAYESREQSSRLPDLID